MGGRLRPESVAGINRNGWPASSGIAGRNRPEYAVGASEIENTKTYIAGSIADMQSLLVDVGENVPKEEDAFLKVEDERVKADCNFRKVCG